MPGTVFALKYLKTRFHKAGLAHPLPGSVPLTSYQSGSLNRRFYSNGSNVLHFWLLYRTSSDGRILVMHSLGYLVAYQPVVHATIRVGRKLPSPESSFRADSQDSFLCISLKITPSVGHKIKSKTLTVLM